MKSSSSLHTVTERSAQARQPSSSTLRPARRGRNRTWIPAADGRAEQFRDKKMPKEGLGAPRRFTDMVFSPEAWKALFSLK